MSVITLPKSPDPAKLRELGRLQDIPVVRQLGSLLLIAATIALGLWLFFWTQKPDYVPVSAGLDAKSSNDAAELLRQQKIPFKVQENGTLAVPQEQIGAARMALAGGGLTGAPVSGIDAMGKEGSFGSSQFMENARYQRAIEGDLARTIATLQPVRDARVHLAVPKPSAFSRQQEPAGASVVIELRSGTALDQGQVNAIVHLVSSSIPSLPPERVTVVDQFGRMLSSQGQNSEEAANNRKFEQQRRLESVYVQRIRELLEPMTGTGRVSAQVSVQMDFSQTEQAQETYGPQTPIVRSEQVSESGNLSANAEGPSGVPGSISNTPGAADANANAAPSGGQSSRNAVRNYEIDRTLTHTRQEPGRVQRVTAAVLIDNIAAGAADKDGKVPTRALNAAELQNIQKLVEQAVGFDVARGDNISVVNAPFAHPELADDEKSGFFPFNINDPASRDLLRIGVGGIALIVLILAVLRPALRGMLGPKIKKQKALADKKTETKPEADEDEGVKITLQDPPEETLNLQPPAEAELLESNVDRARKAVAEDPRRAAEVIRGWVDSDE